MSRREVAKALGISETTVRRMEDTGALKAVTVGEGQHRINLFDPKQVEALKPAGPPAATPGGAAVPAGEPSSAAPAEATVAPEVAAAVFDMFDQGYLRTETAIKLKVPIGVVNKLRAEWEAQHTKPRPPPRPRKTPKEREESIKRVDRLDAAYVKMQERDERIYERFKRQVEEAWGPRRRT
jgi:excisionase family DNA binding protein